MQFKGFKLKFKASQVTDLNAYSITEKIIAKLEDKNYMVLNRTSTKVKFKRDPFRLVWNFQAPYILSGGEFELITSGDKIVVEFNYYIDTFSSFLIMAILIGVLIFQGEYPGILFFGLFYLITGIYQYFATKNTGVELLNSIINGW